MGILDLQSGMTEYISFRERPSKRQSHRMGDMPRPFMIRPGSPCMASPPRKPVSSLCRLRPKARYKSTHASADSQKVYIADQGVYFEKDAGSKVL